MTSPCTSSAPKVPLVCLQKVNVPRNESENQSSPEFPALLASRKRRICRKSVHDTPKSSKRSRSNVPISNSSLSSGDSDEKQLTPPGTKKSCKQKTLPQSKPLENLQPSQGYSSGQSSPHRDKSPETTQSSPSNSPEHMSSTHEDKTPNETPSPPNNSARLTPSPQNESLDQQIQSPAQLSSQSSSPHENASQREANLPARADNQSM